MNSLNTEKLQNRFDQVRSRVSRRKVVVFGSFLVVLVAVLQIWAMNRLAVSGEEIAKIEQAKADLEIENAYLETKVAKNASLTSIRIVAGNLGFSGNKKVEYVGLGTVAQALPGVVASR